MKFGIGLVGGVRSDGDEFCIVFLILVLRRFDSLGGDVECVLVQQQQLRKLGIIMFDT